MAPTTAEQKGSAADRETQVLLPIEDTDGHFEQIPKLSARQQLAATIALCLCTLTHSWLLISVFPYSGFMAIHLVPGIDEETAGSYAGLLASAFMIGRSLTSYIWGKSADVYGRKFVLNASLGLSCLISLLFGLAPTFRLAILWRFLLGVGNGIIGTSKTTVSEIARGDESLETRGMGLVMGMWGWGFLISPALSGLLAEPVRQYPNSEVIHMFEGTLSNFPFLLPNLVSAILCIVTIAMIDIFVPETLPKDKVRSPGNIPSDLSHWVHDRLRAILPQTSNSTSLYDYNLQSNPTYGSTDVKHQQKVPLGPRDFEIEQNQLDSETVREIQFNHSESCSMLSTASPRRSISNRATQRTSDKITDSSGEATLASLWSKKDTRDHLIVYWFSSFVAVAVDEAFPLFCISRTGGLALSEGTIGKVLSASGLIFAVSQYFVYSWIVNKFGLQKSILIGAICSGPLILFLPVSLYLNLGAADLENTLTWEAFAYLSVLMALYRIFALVFFSSITIATNRTVIPSHRGTMNGLSMLGGSFAKGLGPIFSGLLVAFSLSSGVVAPQVGAVLVFTVIGLLGTVTVAMTVLVLGRDKKKSAVRQIL